MKHKMIDLETLGTQPGSVILSIGVVEFDPAAPVESCLGREFYCVVSQEDSVIKGMTVSQDTLDWWNKQSAETRKVLTDSSDPAMSAGLSDSLSTLTTFLGEGAVVWSNGANFDQPLLDVAYNRVGIALPWKYWNSRCYRTIKGICPNAKNLEPKTVCAHNALADAKWQALHLVAMVQSLKIKI